MMLSTHHTTRHEPLVSTARPLAGGAPSGTRAGDLGPAKAELSARGRAGPQSLRLDAEWITAKPPRIKPVLYHVRREEQRFSSRCGNAMALLHSIPSAAHDAGGESHQSLYPEEQPAPEKNPMSRALRIAGYMSPMA